MLINLPYELFEDILYLVLDTHPTPLSLLTVHSTWTNAALPLFHSYLRFTSVRQLERFVWAPGTLQCAVRGGRYVEVTLAGGTSSYGLWKIMGEALERCHGRSGCCRGVRTLRLVLNSHLSDPELGRVSKVLEQIDPEVFSWSGPDPDHHFSTAIVPFAAEALCKALSTWSSLRTLHLSNISFLHDGHELTDALLLLHLRTQALPKLCRVLIDKAVFMRPVSVLLIALGCPSLVELRLTDVYQHSIWGPRLRRRDVEDMLGMEVEVNERAREEGLEVVRRVVRCQARTERLMGGDREIL